LNPALFLPEPGQLVDVRRRRYVVVDITQDPLTPDVLRAGSLLPQHLVTLSSVEDDALGEDLQVIWELEPGATAIHKTPLPEPMGFDAPQRLDTFLNAVRWGAASSADVKAIQAPFRSGVTLEDYQLDPVARAIQMPRVNLLIADDVGLGKTIEAGLVAQELVIRHRTRRILIVCPSALQVQKQELKNQEGLTKTYNRFHDPRETDANILRLRELHREMDEAVARAYGWEDLRLEHGFHETKQGLRYTISEAARREVLDRLLLLNHSRHEEEVQAGLFEQKGAKGTKRAKSIKKAESKQPGATENTGKIPRIFERNNVVYGGNVEVGKIEGGVEQGVLFIE